MGFNESKIIELFQSLNRQNEKIGELQVAEALKDIFNEALYNFNSIRSDIPNYRVDDVPFEFKEQKSEELIKSIEYELCMLRYIKNKSTRPFQALPPGLRSDIISESTMYQQYFDNKSLKV